jgi:hypothetical protein
MPQDPSRKLSAMRGNARQAGAVLKGLFTSTDDMIFVSTLVVKDILAASRIASASWALALFPDCIRLNVGRGAVLQIYRDKVIFHVSASIFDSLPKAKKRNFHFHQEYGFIPDAIEGRLVGVPRQVFEPFDLCHTDLVERAARGRRICFWPQSHSEGLVRFLRSVGYVVPSPSYAFPTAVAAAFSGTDIDEMELTATEGRRVLREHLRAERKPALARRVKEIAFKNHGHLECSVCGFDFEAIYGSIGFMYAEVHHLVPLKNLKGSQRVGESDLVIVCSNCHRMLHKGSPVFAISELQKRMNIASGEKNA